MTNTSVLRDYTLTIRENGKVIDRRPIEDPFIVSTVTARGLRAAWDVLRGRHEVVIAVDGSPETIAHVMSPCRVVSKVVAAEVVAAEVAAATRRSTARR